MSASDPSERASILSGSSAIRVLTVLLILGALWLAVLWAVSVA